MDRQNIRLKHYDLTGRILKIFFEVYNELGFGFLESVYQHSMKRALRDADIEAVSQEHLTVRFRGEPVGVFKADLVVELKCGAGIDSAHEAQLLNYLRATDLEVGLLLNFGPRPSFRRLAYHNERKLGINPRPSA